MQHLRSIFRSTVSQPVLVAFCLCALHLCWPHNAQATPMTLFGALSSSPLGAKKRAPNKSGTVGAAGQIPVQRARQRYLESLNTLRIEDKTIPGLTQAMMGYTSPEGGQLRVILVDREGRPRRLGLNRSIKPTQLYESFETSGGRAGGATSYGTPVLHAFESDVVWARAFNGDGASLASKTTFLTLKATNGRNFTFTPDLLGIHWHQSSSAEAAKTSFIESLFQLFVPPRQHDPKEKLVPMTIEQATSHVNSHGAAMWQLEVRIGPWTLADVDNTITLVKRLEGDQSGAGWAVPDGATGEPIALSNLRKKRAAGGGAARSVKPEVTPLYISSLPHQPDHPIAVLSYFVEHSFLPGELAPEIKRWLNSTKDKSPPPWRGNSQARSLTSIVQLNYPSLESLNKHSGYLELLTDLILAHHWPMDRNQFRRFQPSPDKIERLQNRMRKHQSKYAKLELPAKAYKAENLENAVEELRKIDPVMPPAYNFKALQAILHSISTPKTGADELGDLTVFLMVKSFADRALAKELGNFVVVIDSLVSRYGDNSGVHGFTTAQWYTYLQWLQTAKELD